MYGARPPTVLRSIRALNGIGSTSNIFSRSVGTAPTPAIVVHHLQNSRSNRIVWLMEELGLPYTLKVHMRDKAWFANESLRRASPMGKSPAVELDGHVLTESGYIIHRLLSLDAPERAPDLETSPSDSSYFWSHFSEGSLMLYLQPARFAELNRRVIAQGMSEEEKRGADKYNAVFQKWCREGAERGLAAAEEWLKDGGTFAGAGKIGEGDIMMMFPLNSIQYGGKRRHYDLGPATTEWVERVRGRPGFQRALERMDREAKAQKPSVE